MADPASVRSSLRRLVGKESEFRLDPQPIPERILSRHPVKEATNEESATNADYLYALHALLPNPVSLQV